jgi:acetyl-CoA carboxylase biotin carboxyl carrier protein
MDLRKVKKLIELVEESGIAELEVRSGDEAIRIAMPGAGAPVPAVVREQRAAQPIATDVTSSSSSDDVVVLAAPMAGTFYRAPDPDAAAFVEVGQQVNAGDVVCIIESMKMMHEITAQDGGEVTEICVANGEPISTGETLFRFA